MIEETLEIHLQLYSILREKLPAEAKGRTILKLDEGATLTDLLKQLGIKRRVVISVNDVQESDRSVQLTDGDEVKIFSSVSGG
jgi:thiamine biosynthesis protein ThiS